MYLYVSIEQGSFLFPCSPRRPHVATAILFLVRACAFKQGGRYCVRPVITVTIDYSVMFLSSLYNNVQIVRYLLLEVSDRLLTGLIA